MQSELFHRFARLAYDKAGIALKEGKQALVEARIAKRLRALELPDAGAYIDYLERRDDGQELVRFLDVISTHFTSFFREPDHFDELRRAVEQRASDGARRLRLWSAACSTGEEPYSMAMTLLSLGAARSIDWKILATDIAVQTLAQAQAGRYDAQRIDSVPPDLVKRYFEPLAAQPGVLRDGYVVREMVRERVTFRRLNLSRPPFPMKGPFDVVFCRNVLIYFDQPTRQRLISAIEGLLAPGGLLCIGHTETLNGMQNGLKMTRASVFRRPAPEEVR